MAQVDLQVMRAEAAGVAEHEGAVVALQARCQAACIDALLHPIQRHQQLLGRAEGNRVLPGPLIATGVVAVDDGRPGSQHIIVARELQRRRPRRGDPAPVVERDHPAARVVAKVGRGVRCEAGRQKLARVVLGGDAAVHRDQADPVALGRREAELELAGAAPETVAVGVVVAEGITGAQCRHADAAVLGERSRQVDGAVPAAGPKLRRARTLATQCQTGRQARSGLAAAGEDLHHTTHRIGPVQAGARPAQHLDALDLRQADGGKRSQAQRRRADPHAVDQHHRAARGRAADEHASRLARPAIARELQASLALQQVFERAGRAREDAFAVDQHHIGGHAVQGLGLPGGGDDDCVEAGLGRCRQGTGRENGPAEA